MRVFQASLELHEPTYFASREIGILFQTEAVIGNYALAYALGLCAAPYGFRRGGAWDGGPRYKEDLQPLNARGLYVTPATFNPERLRFSVGQFNALSDGYYSRFSTNRTDVEPNPRSTRSMNVPQGGRLRLLGIHSQATFFLLADDQPPRLPTYIRLGKFNSKARVDWQEQTFRRERREAASVRHYLNPADLPDTGSLTTFDVLAVPPVPLIRNAELSGDFLVLTDALLPAGMRFGVEGL